VKLRRLALKNFRRFSQPLVIDQIGDGLSVLAGDNEEGKSTLLRALRAALFDRHRVSKEVARQFVPFSSEVQPEVAVDFEIRGQLYRLRKGFYQQPFAELELPGGLGRLSGPAVEDKLQELLRFDGPARGLSGAADHGILGLLWLEQGSSFSNWNAAAKDRRDGQAQRSLQSALESEVGEVLGGQHGRELAEAIARRYAEYFDKNRKPRGEYARALSRLDLLREELGKLQDQLAVYEGKVEQLARLRERLLGYEREGRLSRAQKERHEAEEEGRRIESLAFTLREAEAGKQVAVAHFQAESGRARQRNAERQRLDACSERLASCRADLEAAQTLAAPQAERVHATKAELDEAQGQSQRLDAELARCEAAQRALLLHKQAAGLRTRLAQATAAHERALLAQARGEALAIDDRGLRLLTKLDRERAEAEAGLAAVATRLSFAPQAGTSLLLAGQRLAAGSPLTLTETTSLELVQGETALGRLTITPGAEDLSARRARVEQARRKLGQALQDHGAADLAAAEAVAKERADWLQQAQKQRELLAALAPEGLDGLRAALLRAEAEGAPQAISTGSEELTPIEDEAALSQQLQQARLGREGMARALKQARANYEREHEAWQAVQNRLVRAEVELESATREHGAVAEALAAARRREDDEALQAAVQAAEGALRLSEDRVAVATQALASARPDEVRLRLQAKREAVEQIGRDTDATRQQISSLEGELRALGQQGLGELRDEKQGELERAQALAERMSREAEALRLLSDTLGTAERSAKETFLQPVQRRVQPYLDLLLPGTSLHFSDGDLAISHLRRGAQEEPFEALSIGTREQLAVLTRLAFADLLRDQGQPTCIVLDDVLVYADDKRFDRMLLLLRRAAEKQQIVVLTCRGRDYVSQGLPVRWLSECIARSAA